MATEFGFDPVGKESTAVPFSGYTDTVSLLAFVTNSKVPVGLNAMLLGADPAAVEPSSVSAPVEELMPYSETLSPK